MAATEAATRAARRIDDLYRIHAAEVYRYAYAVLGNTADAEDVTQTTFMNALRAIERGEVPRKPAHWLISIAHNLVRQRFRQQARAPSQGELLDAQASVVPSLADPSLDDLVRALQQIPPAQREALVMRELEGRPYAEIASILEISTGALETLLFRARRSLGDELENLVTCSSAELSLSRQRDSRLSRKERRRLEAHVRNCSRCARLAATRSAQGRAWKGLAVLPLPLSLTLVKGGPTATAASTLPTIGMASASASASGAAAGGGGIAAGSVAAKVAAAVVAATIIGGVGYEGVRVAQGPEQPEPRGGTPAVPAKGSARPATSVGPAASGPASSDSLASTPAPSRRAVVPVGPSIDGNGAGSAAGPASAPTDGPPTASDIGQVDSGPPAVIAEGGAAKEPATPGPESRDARARGAAPDTAAASTTDGVDDAEKIAGKSATAPGQVKKTAPDSETAKSPNAAVGRGQEQDDTPGEVSAAATVESPSERGRPVEQGPASGAFREQPPATGRPTEGAGRNAAAAGKPVVVDGR
jgi:RNA polymerase sigma-70 factor (ECF subfamily)